MANLILKENLSNSSVSLNIVLTGFALTSFTPSTVGEVFWRWEDEPETYPQFLGAQTAGFTLATPFDLQGKAIRLFLVSKTADGRRSVSDVREAEQVVFSADTNYGILTDGGNALSDNGTVLDNNS